MNAPLPSSRSETTLSPAEIRSILLGLVLAMLLAALDQTIVATAMPTIGRELGDVTNLPWVVTAYLLASTAVTPLYGKLSDIHGRRVTLLVAILVFVVGSVACALSTSMLALSLSRGLQGLGGGGLIALAQTIIADVVAPKERGRYQVYFASVFVVSSAAGPLLGGFFAERLHWSFIFWINLPLGALALFMTNAKLKRLPRHERPHKLDYLGAVLMTAATSTLLLALSWGGVNFPWHHPVIIGLFATSAAFAVAFVTRLRTASEPLIPITILDNPVVRMATLSACFGMGTFIGMTIYAPIYLEGARGLLASQSGVALVPLMASTVVGAVLSGRSMLHFRHYKRLPLLGLATGVVSAFVLAGELPRLALWQIEVLFALVSLGIGTVLPLSTVCVQNAVRSHELGTATGTMNFFRQLGGALVVAMFGAIVLNAGDGSQTIEHLRGHAFDPVAAAALTNTFRLVFATAGAGLVASFFCLAAMEERPLASRAGPAAAMAE